VVAVVDDDVTCGGCANVDGSDVAALAEKEGVVPGAAVLFSV
jgi:hypothetical protein